MARPRTGAQQQRGGGVAQRGGAMSFHQIGEIEGITHSGAVMVYQRGIRKLMETYPEALEIMREMAAHLERGRAERRSSYEDSIYG